MKKIICLLLVFTFTKSFCVAHEVWKMYPIQVNQVMLPGNDSYFTFSTYDSLLAMTVIDSTPIYSGFINQDNNYGMFAYYLSWNDYYHIVVYDINQHAFTQDSVYGYIYCFSSPYVLGNYAQFWSCDAGGSPQYEKIFYYDIVNGVINQSGASYSDVFGFWATFFNGWYTVFEGGDLGIQQPDQYSFQIFQKGMFGSFGGITGFNVDVAIQDGILGAYDYDTPSARYYSNDSCNSFSYNNTTIFNTSNGLAYISDSLKMHLASDDAWINQWVIRDIPEPYDAAKSKLILKNRITSFAVDTAALANIYCAAYNTITHQWVVDSLQSNRVDSLVITNGTVTWTDSAGVQFTRGYSDSIGWGNFNTPLKIDFYAENYQSPTNGNLVYVRNYTIGTDNILFDFGDGYTTTYKSQSHLYKNPNGTYRSSSSNFSYNICQYAAGQSSCKTVSFTVDTKNLPKENASVNIRYAKEKGIFLIDNKTNKNLRVQVFNVMGQLVKTFTCQNEIQTFSLAQNSNGIYLVSVTTTDGSLQKSFKLVNGR